MTAKYHIMAVLSLLYGIMVEIMILKQLNVLKYLKKRNMKTMSHQAIGRQRIYIKPDLFIQIYKKFIDKIYKTHKHFSEFKEYIIATCY